MSQCPVCGADLSGRHSSTKYCSTGCKNHANREKLANSPELKKKKNDQIAGIQRRKRLATLSEREPIHCRQCGVLFTPLNSQRQCCSAQCSQRYSEANYRATAAGKEKRHEIAKRAYLKQADKWRAKQRQYYADNADKCRMYTRQWKAANPEKAAAHTTDYRVNRHLRVAAASDGTAGSAIAGLLRGSRCLYCNARLDDLRDKRVDHMHPVALGGSHSAANLALACDLCNARKGAMPLVDWLALLPEVDRRRVTRHYIKLNGAPPDQLQLLMPVESVKRPRPISAEKAEREARRAWDWWLSEGAPAWWLDGYWANHQRPWLDKRLTQAERDRLRSYRRYHLDAACREYQIRGKPSRSPEYRRQQRLRYKQAAEKRLWQSQ